MEIVNKLPRTTLVAGFTGFMVLGGFMLKGAYADLDQTKSRALRTEQSVQQLSSAVEEIKIAQKSFGEKYDRNQEENQRVFRQVLSDLAQIKRQ